MISRITIMVMNDMKNGQNYYKYCGECKFWRPVKIQGLLLHIGRCLNGSTEYTFLDELCKTSVDVDVGKRVL